MIGVFAASFVVSLGTFWAFQRGANDFHVFFVAWQHVLTGSAAQIYSVTPDRFLYAPGFAWILSPLALLPESWALGVWCFAKAAIVGWVVRATSRSYAQAGMAALGVLLWARPVLIDFQYGQVNLIILGASFWALLRHFKPGTSRWDFVSWVALGACAVAKIYPLPLLLVPFFATQWGERRVEPGKLTRERWGVVLGTVMVLAIPLVSVNPGQLAALMSEWKVALLNRGLPLESHNQSFSAFLHHYASGEPTEIIAQHRRQLHLGYAVFSENSIEALTAAWTFAFAGIMLAWIFFVPKIARTMRPEIWAATLVALQILPSHLVWKPYFVMALPLACLSFAQRPRWLVAGVAFALINFSGFDFLGAEAGARLEAAAILLWCHLLLVFSFADHASSSPREPSDPVGTS